LSLESNFTGENEASECCFEKEGREEVGWVALSPGTVEPVPVRVLLSVTCEKRESLACAPAKSYVVEQGEVAACHLASFCLRLGKAVYYTF